MKKNTHLTKSHFFIIISLICLVFNSKAFNPPIQSDQNLVISQFYTYGGMTGSLYKNDFVEIHNRFNLPISLTGKSIQMSSANGNFTSFLVLPNITLQAGGYFLVQFGSSGNNGDNLPIPDAITSINLPSSAGKIALVHSTSALGCGSANVNCSTNQTDLVIDLVTYGVVTGLTEGTSLNSPSINTIYSRNFNFCDDSNNNNSDFSINSSTIIKNITSSNNVCYPKCNTLYLPFQNNLNATDIQELTSPLTLFNWTKVNNATGYFISLGTNQDANNIINNMDAGNNNTFDTGIELPHNSIINCKITPYNNSGSALNCPNHSFKTGTNWGDFEIKTEKEGDYIVVKINSNNTTQITHNLTNLYFTLFWPTEYGIDLNLSSFASTLGVTPAGPQGQFGSIHLRSFFCNVPQLITSFPIEVMRIKPNLNSPTISKGVFKIWPFYNALFNGPLNVGAPGNIEPSPYIEFSAINQYIMDVKGFASDIPISDCSSNLKINKNIPNCSNPLSGNIILSSTRPILNYKWTNGAISGNGTDTIISNLAHGNYEITITFNNGCEFKRNVQLENICFPKLKAKVYLNNFNIGNGLMNNLGTSVSNFPIIDPYKRPPLNSFFIHNNNNDIDTIKPNILNQTGSNAIVDWLFIELRKNITGNTFPEYTKSVLLESDGDIVSTNGQYQINFSNAPIGNYYVAIRHKNHAGFRTLNPILFNSSPVFLNFTNNSIPLYGSSPLVQIGNNIYSMIAGDANSDGAIDAFDYVIWETQNGLFDDYQLNADFNLDGAVDAFDYVIWELNNGKYEELD